MAGVTVRVANDLGLATQRVQLPYETPVATLLKVLPGRLKLPLVQNDGSPIRYRMYLNNLELNPDETLSQGNVHDNDMIMLRQSASIAEMGVTMSIVEQDLTIAGVTVRITNTVTVRIISEAGVATHRARLPDDVAVGNLLKALPVRLNRPLVQEDGNPIGYRMYFNNVELKLDETLSQAKVRDGDTISLRSISLNKEN